jgi:hypothetical protein
VAGDDGWLAPKWNGPLEVTGGVAAVNVNEGAVWKGLLGADPTCEAADANGFGAVLEVGVLNENPDDDGAAGVMAAVGVTGVGANRFGGAPKADVGVVPPSDF